MMTIVDNTMLKKWNLLRVELKCSHTYTKIYIEVIGGLINYMGEVLSQCMWVLNQKDVRFKSLTILFPNYTSI